MHPFAELPEPSPSTVGHLVVQVVEARREMEQLRVLIDGAFHQMIDSFFSRHPAGLDPIATQSTDNGGAVAALQVQDIADQLIVHVDQRLGLIHQGLGEQPPDAEFRQFALLRSPIAHSTELVCGTVELF